MTKNRSMATVIAIIILDPLSVTTIALAGVIAQIPMMFAYSKFIQKNYKLDGGIKKWLRI